VPVPVQNDKNVGPCLSQTVFKKFVISHYLASLRLEREMRVGNSLVYWKREGCSCDKAASIQGSELEEEEEEEESELLPSFGPLKKPSYENGDESSFGCASYYSNRDNLKAYICYGVHPFVVAH
jgi:hypothetical protein